ncbi:MAG TPA: hypothetical protein VKU00_08135 [Chthonomonadaceae bacterium]|nr:hypothetical protein [Chthonomonadaceae bacterium]
MSDFFSGIVERCGKAWAVIGWVLFIGLAAVPFVAPTLAAFLLFGISIGILWLVWWLVDAVDQQVEGWQYAVGMLLLAIGFVSLSIGVANAASGNRYGSFLILAAWILYWAKVRE